MGRQQDTTDDIAGISQFYLRNQYKMDIIKRQNRKTKYRKTKSKNLIKIDKK